MIPVLLHRCTTPLSHSSSSPSSGKSIYIPYTGSPGTGSWSITTSLAQSQQPSVKLGQRAVFLSNCESSLPDRASQACRVSNTGPSMVCPSQTSRSEGTQGTSHLIRVQFCTPPLNNGSVHREFTVRPSFAGVPRQS
ncbi:hypothetical protein PISMIDRAFT_689326 [Pisolithus microcarpus 441]|uniref:Uncharacterized protein n=1 Tax=Pisolithus microcarpus 441 TaxID=765257 RepID=A0A0C9YFC4_9AGAM|nr:hypothetical protein PISMIDRAFT_689326 [Pisolithus microcarpus 441]